MFSESLRWVERRQQSMEKGALEQISQERIYASSINQ